MRTAARQKRAPMTRGGRRPNQTGRPALDDADPPAIPILLRKQDRARAEAAGEPIAARVRRALDVLAALEDREPLSVLRRIGGVA